MGNIEKRSAERKKRIDIQHLVLSSIAVAGVLSVALVAPNVLGAMDKLGLLPNARQSEIIHAARKRLLRKGYLSKTADGKLGLTPSGHAYFARQQLKHATSRKPRRWDGRWRVLIFDVPEFRKGQRELIRRTLAQIGFVRLQDSVWLYPYDCEDLIVLLKADFHVGKDLLYMIVDSLENDRAYRDHFELPLEK